MTPFGIFPQQVTILRASLIPDPNYGSPIRDWSHAAQTVVNSLVYPESATENLRDQELMTSYWIAFFPSTVDLRGTDRVIISGEISGDDPVTTKVDGVPFAWRDNLGRLVYIRARLELIEGG
jgi:hypothetical protein